MTRTVNRVVTSAAFLAAALLGGCVAEPPLSRPPAPVPAAARTSSDPVTLVPEGWTPLADSSGDPSVRMTLRSADGSAVITLREFIISEPTDASLRRSGPCAAAHLSARLRLASDRERVRLTRAPAPLNDMAEGCFYVTDVEGLLVRVAVFRKNGSYFESEARQRTTDASMDTLARVQSDMLQRIQRAEPGRFRSLLVAAP